MNKIYHQNSIWARNASTKNIKIVPPNKVSVQIQPIIQTDIMQIKPIESARSPFINHMKNETAAELHPVEIPKVNPTFE